MAGIKGDFTGFYFNGVHSSTLNITRISGGDRYDLSIFPSFQDRTGEVAGANRIYYFGTTEKERELNIEVAFDGVTEVDLRAITNLFLPNTIGALIFDETPYKMYYAKVKNSPEFKVIPFLNKDSIREYKGEATFNFICYDPKAYSRFKFLDEYNKTNIIIWADDNGNKSEWQTSARLLSTQGTIDKFFYNLNTVSVYNPGDMDTPFKVYIEGVYNSETQKYDYDFKLNITGDSTRQLVIYGSSNYKIIEIDMLAHLTISCDTTAATYSVAPDGVYYKDGSSYILRSTGSETGSFYNIDTSSLTKLISDDLFYAGNYFLIPMCATTSITKTLAITTGVGATKKGTIVGLEYNYLFY